MDTDVGPAYPHTYRSNPQRGYESTLKLKLFILSLACTYLILQYLAYTQFGFNMHNKESELNVTKQSRLISQTVPTPYSKVQCVGESFDDYNSPSFRSMYRSCRYKNLCYKSGTKELVLIPTSQHQSILSLMRQDIYLSSVSKAVMPNPILSSRIGKLDLQRPRYLKARDDYKYNQIVNASNIIWIPILPKIGESPLLDLFLPIYRLLELFDLENETYGLFFLKSLNSSGQGLESFLSSMRIERPWIVYDADIPTNNYPNSVDLTCFENSVMGMGALGIHRPHSYASNNSVPPNHIGRGNTFQKFRGYILKKMDISPSLNLSFTIGYSALIPQSMLPQLASTGLKWIALPPAGIASLRLRILEICKLSGLVLTSREDKTAALFLQDSSLLILIGEPQEDWDFWTNIPYIKLFLLTQNIPLALEKVIQAEMLLWNSQTDEKNMLKRGNVSHSDIFPLELKVGSPKPTTIHCIGEKLYPDSEGAHQFRSCYFENICFHLVTKQFKIVQPVNVFLKNDQFLQDGNYFSSLVKPLALYPQPKNKHGIKAEIIDTDFLTGVNTSYYHFKGVLLSNRVLNTCNPGMWQIDSNYYSHYIAKLPQGICSGICGYLCFQSWTYSAFHQKL
jgi:hypothetical protein